MTIKRLPMGRAVRDAIRVDRRTLPAGAALAGRILRRISRRVEVFCRIDAYERYDVAHIARDDRVTENDIAGANVIGAAITPASWAPVTALDRLPGLTAIPADAELFAFDDAAWTQEMRPRVASLLEHLAGLPQVETARATKVLYLKRPALVPACDTQLLAALTGSGSSDVANGLRAIDLLRRIGIAHRATLAQARAKLAARGFDKVTELRILECALSMEASAHYDPLWESLGWTSWHEPEPPELRLFED